MMAHPAAVAARQLSEAFEQQAEAQAKQQRDFDQLKDDFKYNLRLLEERDRDLCNYDSVYQKLKDELLRRDHEQSELKIALDEARRQKELEAERTAKVELHYQKRLADLDHEMEAKLGAKDRQLSEQHGDFNNDKLDLERKLLTEKESSAGIRRELSAKFEAASEGVTRELRESLTVAKTQTLEQQSQNNQLAAQLVIAEGRCVKLTTEVEAASEALNAAEMVGKRMEWELAETSKANAAQIAEMQWEVDHKKTGMVATIERFDRKIALLSEGIGRQEHAVLLREQEILQRESLTKEAIARAQLDTRNHQIALEDQAVQHKKVVSRLVREVETLQDGIRRLRRDAQNAQAETADSVAARDNQLRAMNEQLALSEGERVRANLETARYKVSLKQAIECEKEAKGRLRASQGAQTVEMSEVTRRAKSETDELTHSLLIERRAIEEQLSMAQQTIEQQKTVLNAVQSERMDALQLAQEWKCKATSGGGQDAGLQAENAKLRTAIRQMRLEMETAAVDDNAAVSTTELSAGDALTSAEELRAETILLNDQIAHLRAASRDDRTLVAALKEQRQAATAGMQSAKEETLRLGTELLSARRAVEQHHRISSRRAQELGRLQAALADSRDAFDPAGMIDGSELARLLQVIATGVERALAAHTDEGEAHQGPLVGTNELELQEKLQAAGQDVKRLLREREQLVDINNSLRSSRHGTPAGLSTRATSELPRWSPTRPSSQATSSPSRSRASPNHRYGHGGARGSVMSSMDSGGLREVFQLLESNENPDWLSISKSFSHVDASPAADTVTGGTVDVDPAHELKAKPAPVRKKGKRAVRNYAVKN